MRDVTPTVYLLAGPSGAGKSTYARTLAAAGVVLLAPAADGAVSEVEPALVEHVQAGRDVVIDHGLDQAEREAFKRVVEEQGAQWCVINLSPAHTRLVHDLENTSRRS